MSSAYCSNYKTWKDTLFWVHNDDNFPEAIFDNEEGHRFPIYWMGDLVLVTSSDHDKINESDKDEVNLLKKTYMCHKC